MPLIDVFYCAVLKKQAEYKDFLWFFFLPLTGHVWHLSQFGSLERYAQRVLLLQFVYYTPFINVCCPRVLRGK